MRISSVLMAVLAAAFLGDLGVVVGSPLNHGQNYRHNISEALVVRPLWHKSVVPYNLTQTPSLTLCGPSTTIPF